MQSFLDIGKSDEDKILESIDFLRSNGYMIIKLSDLEETSVKKAQDLVDLFYALLQFYNQDRDIHYGKASKKDLGLAKQLITHRENICGDKKRALKECALIIKCVVKYEGYFKFTEPLHSFDCFGHDSMKWVVDKAISIINKENKEIDELELNTFLEELYALQEKESLNCLDKKIEELKIFLKGENDGS